METRAYFTVTAISGLKRAELYRLFETQEAAIAYANKLAERYVAQGADVKMPSNWTIREFGRVCKGDRLMWSFNNDIRQAVYVTRAQTGEPTLV